MPVSISCAVIGGGPAGLMAADVLSEAGCAVTVYDQMPSLGRKFLMAGIGGLNLTHAEALDTFLSRYRVSSSPLLDAIKAFPPDALRQWCVMLGHDTFVGTSGRVFPQSFKASPLLRSWLARLNERGVEMCTRHRWTGWQNGSAVFETPRRAENRPA